MSFNFIPFRPRNRDGILRVVILGRVPTIHQNITNVAASQDACEKRIRDVYQGEALFTRLGDRGSGWKIARAAIREAERLIRAGEVDIVIMEDLGRAYRNPQFQFHFAHLCIDCATRLICWGDCLDTATSTWEITLHAAVLQHGVMVPVTRRRVRRTADHNFHSGGMVLKIPFGYRRVSPEEAAQGNGERVAKIPQWTPIIREMAQRFLQGEAYEETARWLNDSSVPTGEYVESGKWTGKLVRDLLANPLLCGVRIFRELEFQIIYETGDHKRVPNETPERREVPELAHLTVEEQKAVMALMLQYKLARKRKGTCPRKNVPRKSSYWPGQHLRCSICGDELYWMSRGQLRCQNAFPGRPRTCWNRTVVQAGNVHRKLLPRLLAELRARPEAWESLVNAAWEEFQQALSQTSGKKDCLEAEIRGLQQEIKRIADLVCKTESEELLGRLNGAEAAKKARENELAAVVSRAEVSGDYLSREDVEADIENAIQRLARTSYGFDDFLRRPFPDFLLIPVQALDSGQVRPRIRLTIPDRGAEEGNASVIELDAFDYPLQVRLSKPVAELKATHPDWTFQRVGQELGAHKKLCHDAYRYSARMEAAGQTDPYRILTEPPENASRWAKTPLCENQNSSSSTSHGEEHPQASGGSEVKDSRESGIGTSRHVS